MALIPEVEELLKDYPEAHQKYLRTYYDANPDLQAKLKEQLVGQRDLSRKYQELGTKEKEALRKDAEAKALFEKNTQWFRDTEADFNRLETENATLKAKAEELEKLKGAAGAPGAAPADMAKYDKALADVNKLLAETQKALKDSHVEFGKRFDAGGMWIFEVENQAEAYRLQFNKPLDRLAFTKFMNEQNIMDPKKAMELYSAEDKKLQWEADKEKELRTKIEAENAAKQVPYATGTGAMIEKGPLQYYMERNEKGPQTTQQAAVAAAAELAAEGKG